MTDKKQAPKRIPLLSSSEWSALPVPPKEWIVDGLLRTGRRRPSILAGKAGDGKSTLAKQLAIALAQGIPFLGRATKRSPSIYWQTEDEVPDVVEALLQMGYVPGRDEEIYILDGTAEENNVHTLRQALIEHRDAKVVIVETLDDLIKSRDSNSGTDVREAFDLLHTAVMKDFAPNIAVLGLHHLNKTEMATQSEGLTGSLQWRGRTDGVWYYRLVSEEDGRRTFQAEVRSGKRFPKSYVEWNEDTQTVSLGQSVYEERKAGGIKTGDRILTDVVQFYTRNPYTTLNKCKASVSGHKPTIRKIILKAALDEILLVRGEGVSRDPFLYGVNPDPPKVEIGKFGTLEEQVGAHV
jgi:AAA domain